MPETTIAVANVRIVHDKRRNLARFVELIEEAAAQRVDFLVLPEVGLQGYADLALTFENPGVAEQREYYFREAEAIPGPATDRIGELCERAGMHVQLGLAERAVAGNVIYNSAVLVGPGGVVGAYRKIHNQFEYPYFMPGDGQGVFDLPFARVGGLICYDICFPELVRSYALQGVEVGAVSTAWPMLGHDPDDDFQGWGMDMAVQANAFFNQIWMAISNHCERGAYSTGTDYYGNSQIVDPFGKVVACGGQQEGLVVHTADLRDEVLRARTVGLFGKNFLQDRRPELYAPTVEALLTDST